MKIRLTKRSIEMAVPPKTGILTLNDTDISGFQVRVTPSGQRTYYLYYRSHGRERRLKLGNHGDITCEQARKLAVAAKGQVAAGKDPAAERHRRNEDTRLMDVYGRFMSDHAAPRLKPRTVEHYRHIYETAISPRLGRKRLNEISRADIERLHGSLRDTPTRANHALSLIRALINKAIAWEMVAEHRNPCTGIEKFPQGRHERYLTPDELQRLLATLDRFDMERRTLPSAVAAIRLLIFTGCRRDEILNLRWSEVHLERSELVLPDSKTGRKRVFLNEPARALLAALSRDLGSDLVINGKTPGTKLQGLEKIWQRIRREAELEDVRLHDLRHNFASAAISSGLSLPIVGKLLGHKSLDATKRYAHLADEVLKEGSLAVGRQFSTNSSPVTSE